MEEALKGYLLAVAQAYAEAKGIALATVSRRLHGNDGFLRNFADGKISVTLKKYDVMLAAFAADWPENAIWPKPNGMLKMIRGYPQRPQRRKR